MSAFSIVPNSCPIYVDERRRTVKVVYGLIHKAYKAQCRSRKFAKAPVIPLSRRKQGFESPWARQFRTRLGLRVPAFRGRRPESTRRAVFDRVVKPFSFASAAACTARRSVCSPRRSGASIGLLRGAPVWSVVFRGGRLGARRAFPTGSSTPYSQRGVRAMPQKARKQAPLSLVAPQTTRGTAPNLAASMIGGQPSPRPPPRVSRSDAIRHSHPGQPLVNGPITPASAVAGADAEAFRCAAIDLAPTGPREASRVGPLETVRRDAIRIPPGNGREIVLADNSSRPDSPAKSQERRG